MSEMEKKSMTIIWLEDHVQKFLKHWKQLFILHTSSIYAIVNPYMGDRNDIKMVQIEKIYIGTIKFVPVIAFTSHYNLLAWRNIFLFEFFMLQIIIRSNFIFYYINYCLFHFLYQYKIIVLIIIIHIFLKFMFKKLLYWQ